jgi:NMD protein affecting ribosome stability and mRNA decay
MKSDRGGFRPLRHEQVMTPPREDSYREGAKFHEPATCRDCGATYHKGRWTWGIPAADSVEQRCPACQRVHDDVPAGYVTMKGDFVLLHRDEILALARNCEAHEKEEHPLQRIMGIADRADGIEVTTTDGHLARGIAEALHEAFKGTVKVSFAKEENLVRAVWTRP